MPPVLRCRGGNDDFMTLAGPDLVVASGAPIGLLGLVWLHVANIDADLFVSVGVGPVVLGSHRGRAAHSTSNATTTSALTTSAMSLRRLTC